MRERIELGTCTVPDGQSGAWRIETFTITKPEADLENMRAAMNRRGLDRVSPGEYRRLVHETRGVVMSNTWMEVITNYDAYKAARGRVLINGLGLGMLLEAILAKRNHGLERRVDYVRVIEREADVIKLVAPHFAHDPRVEIVHADALTYRPPAGDRQFDYAWHDIWDTISAANLPSMATLGRKWGKRRARAQGWWRRDDCREANR